MKQTALCFAITLLAASSGLLAQNPSSNFGSTPSSTQTAGEPVAPPVSNAGINASPPPFSRLALSGGFGANGINVQVAVNANRYLNIRGIGNYFSYTLSNIKTSGTVDSGTLNLATGGVSIDLYPFPNHGFRLSPGVLFYNQNGVTATTTVPGGSSFTLNHNTYYSSPSNPVSGTGSVVLNTQNPSFTMTTGWGNLISRRGGHFSVPFEIGAAFVGAPKVSLLYTTGQVCSDSAGDPPCYSVTSYSAFTSDVNAQIAKYNSDLNVLKVYPIISIGIGYNFKLR